MKILADENIEREFVGLLRDAGFDVLSVREGYVGNSDNEILRVAKKVSAVILTYDTDFGELVFRYKLKSHGVVLLCLSGLSLTAKAEKTIEVLSHHEDELENAFTVISENSVRIRKAL